jgi:hypothetical protein
VRNRASEGDLPPNPFDDRSSCVALWNVVGPPNEGFADFGYPVVGIFVTCRLVSVVVRRTKGYGNLRLEQP